MRQDASLFVGLLWVGCMKFFSQIRELRIFGTKMVLEVGLLLKIISGGLQIIYSYAILGDVGTFRCYKWNFPILLATVVSLKCSPILSDFHGVSL